MTKPLTVGVLALQGCVQPHRAHIEKLGAVFKEVRTEEDLDSIDCLILPGGESTTQLKLIHTFGLGQKFKSTLQRVPVWGICAGAILMAKQVYSPKQESFSILDMEVERNSYGRQLDSFHTLVNDYTVSFIRAPRILSTGPSIQILAHQEGSPTWVQSGKYMATTFHPELNPDTPSPMLVHFLKLVD